MNELVKNKQKIFINLVLLLAISVGSFVLVIGATPSFKSSNYSIVLMLLTLIEIPAIIGVGMAAIRSINEMVENDEKHRATSIDEIEKLEKEVEEKAKEADDLSFNLNKLSDDMGEYEDWKAFGEKLLNGVSKQIEIVVGLVYYYDSVDKKFKSIADYAYYSDVKPNDFIAGDGLTGQVVKDKRAMFIQELPDGYVNAISGLGKHKPNHLAIIPLLDKDDVVGVMEIATFKPLERGLSRRVNEISKFIGDKASKLG